MSGLRTQLGRATRQARIGRKEDIEALQGALAHDAIIPTCVVVAEWQQALRTHRRGVAQPGRAPGSGPGGRRFKSSLPDQSFQQLAILASCWGTQKGLPFDPLDRDQGVSPVRPFLTATLFSRTCIFGWRQNRALGASVMGARENYTHSAG